MKRTMALFLVLATLMISFSQPAQPVAAQASVPDCTALLIWLWLSQKALPVALEVDFLYVWAQEPGSYWAVPHPYWGQRWDTFESFTNDLDFCFGLPKSKNDGTRIYEFPKISPPQSVPEPDKFVFAPRFYWLALPVAAALLALFLSRRKAGFQRVTAR